MVNEVELAPSSDSAPEGKMSYDLVYWSIRARLRAIPIVERFSYNSVYEMVDSCSFDIHFTNNADEQDEKREEP